jgi:hypothetical protein
MQQQQKRQQARTGVGMARGCCLCHVAGHQGFGYKWPLERQRRQPRQVCEAGRRLPAAAAVWRHCVASTALLLLLLLLLAALLLCCRTSCRPVLLALPPLLGLQQLRRIQQLLRVY